MMKWGIVSKLPHFYAEEEGVLKMDQYELVRTGHRVYGQNISELSRLTGHSRNTIKKAIRGGTGNGAISRFPLLAIIW